MTCQKCGFGENATETGIFDKIGGRKSAYKTTNTIILSHLIGTNHEQNTGHYYLSGFFDVNNQSYYYSINDVRCSRSNNMLIRTAQNHKDFTGGTNHYIPLGENMLINNLPR